MSKFKVGDRVRDAARRDDVGVITRRASFPDSWYVKWETGVCTGEELWLEEDEIELVGSNSLDGSKLTINGITYTLVKD